MPLSTRVSLLKLTTSRFLGTVLCLVPAGLSILYLATARRPYQSVSVAQQLLWVGFSATAGTDTLCLKSMN